MSAATRASAAPSLIATSAFPSAPRSATTSKPTAAASTSAIPASSSLFARNPSSKNPNRRSTSAIPRFAPVGFYARLRFLEKLPHRPDDYGRLLVDHKVARFRQALNFQVFYVLVQPVQVSRQQRDVSFAPDHQRRHGDRISWRQEVARFGFFSTDG